MLVLAILTRLVGWGLTALLTQFRSYRAVKVKTIYSKDLIEINSWSKVVVLTSKKEE